ncbi:MAG TPA: class I SAM-dependent methyltransferase [Solirubrobacteraceae bacterium]|jgi:demethylmenaquinone methyltransferase/2-methoxy-6-polyprenyl-1,4-benzoquinol methylase|nr:class I SAM-dependent methyltransferase [Solirubrobacteraceae bacterium]
MSTHAPGDVDATAPASPLKREALELFSGLPRRYDALSAALSFWQDPRWRRALVAALSPADGERVLDVATGTGMVAAELLSRARCSVVGIDQSPQMLAGARARFAGASGTGGTGAPGAAGTNGAAAASGAHVELVQGQAEALPFADGSFDGLTVTYLLRYVDDPRATVRELARVLRPGGRMASLEFGVPPWRPAYLAWRLYTAVGLPALGRIDSREWAQVGRYLGPSIRGFYERHPLEAIVEYWHEAGMRDVQVRRMSLGGGVVMWASKGVDTPSGARGGDPHP